MHRMPSVSAMITCPSHVLYVRNRSGSNRSAKSSGCKAAILAWKSLRQRYTRICSSCFPVVRSENAPNACRGKRKKVSGLVGTRVASSPRSQPEIDATILALRSWKQRYTRIGSRKLQNYKFLLFLFPVVSKSAHRYSVGFCTTCRLYRLSYTTSTCLCLSCALRKKRMK